MTNPYLEPVSPWWRRLAGSVVLAAAAGLTVVLVCGLFDFIAHPASRRTFTSSTVVFALILLALCGICWQAGLRLACSRGDGRRSLFSRPAWFAIGTAMLVMVAMMAAVVVAARRPTLLDYQVILTLGAFGVWCIVLAFRRASGGR
jgi:hypothetical protein